MTGTHGARNFHLLHWPRLHEKAGRPGELDASRTEILHLRLVWFIVTVISTMAVLLLWTTALGL